MGWSYSRENDKQSYIQECLGEFAEGYTPLAHKAVGNHIWIALQRPDGSVGACLLLLSKWRGMGWGQKWISEEEGPYYYDCPKSILDLCTEPTNEYAQKWREQVRQYHEKRKNRAQPAPGVVVRIGQFEYKLERPYAPRKGWLATRVCDGRLFRVPARQLYDALQDVELAAA